MRFYEGVEVVAEAHPKVAETSRRDVTVTLMRTGVGVGAGGEVGACPHAVDVPTAVHGHPQKIGVEL